MAKTNFLELINRVLRRVTQPAILDVADATGISLIISNLLNEAQSVIFNENLSWYSLYKTRIFKTVNYTASTIAFVNSDPDTITDSASGFSNFSAGMEIAISGSSSNNGNFLISSVSAGTITLQNSDLLTAEVAGSSITIIAFGYPVASNFGRSISLSDVSNNLTLQETDRRSIEELNINATVTGNPVKFTLSNDNYILYPIPGAVYNIRDLYWAFPATMTVNTDTTDLPIECETLLIYWAWGEVLNYTNNFDRSDRIKVEYRKMLKKAKRTASTKLDRLLKMGAQSTRRSFRLPPEYGNGICL